MNAFGQSAYYTPTNQPRHEKTSKMPYANNKGADQPAGIAHPRSVISTFVVHCLGSIILLLAKSEMSRL